FGPDGFEKGVDLKKPDDYYVRQAANVAVDAKVPDASDEEIELFTKARRHLSKTVFDVERWKKIAGDNWRKTVYALNRGGAFEDFEEGKKGKQPGWIVHTYKKSGQNLINMYQEKTATTKNSRTGKYFYGLPAYMPLTDSLGNEIKFDPEYDLQLITHREVTQTKSRTCVDYWLLAVLSENFILINKKDADRLGLKDGDKTKVVSPSNPEGTWDLKAGGKLPMVGKVKVSQAIAPGVIAFSLGFGNWATGSRDISVDGVVVKGDERRGRGIHANAAMLVDPHLKNTCLSDLTGGSAVFYDTKVKLVKA
ncbi:MAG: molybdopterin oxidoreductase, partial [Euryarchaeota archaeon]|nr:molybdopterin oxidoreductase [Euryarchaeota archaeon]